MQCAIWRERNSKLTDNLINYLDQLHESLKATRSSDQDRNSLELEDASARAVALLTDAKKASKKILLVGNGGSAAVASHMQNDLCKAGDTQALVFTEQPLLTAYANDDGYDSAYESSMKLWAESGDVLIAISSSGSSENILRACGVAKKTDGRIITMSGFSPENPLRSIGDVNFYVPSESYGVVETAHAALGHYLTDSLAGLLD